MLLNLTQFVLVLAITVDANCPVPADASVICVKFIAVDKSVTKLELDAIWTVTSTVAAELETDLTCRAA